LENKSNSSPTLIEAIIPVAFLTIAISVNVFVFGDTSLDGSNQIVLLISSAVAAIITIKTGVGWKKIQKGIVKSISNAIPAIIILLLIGSLAGTWMISGIVPAMIYYGLQILNPTVFLVAACIVSAIVSLVTGSSWSTVATLGVALLGIGTALGIPTGMVGGAIISGAYFGDKMSPLSDTTNLAPAMAGTDLFTHIRYLAWTTIPSIIIALIIFLLIGLNRSSDGVSEDIIPVLSTIESTFNITPWLFIVPALVITLIVNKTPAIPALLAGAVSGGIFAIIFQPDIIRNISQIDDNYSLASYIAVMKAMYTNIAIKTDHEIVSNLLETGGMSGMLKTVWLIITAMIYGGVMEAGGLLKKITESIIKLAKSTGSLISSTVFTCIFFNVTASDQYLSIVVPGKMFAKTYKKRNLTPQNLSRTLEDGGTVTSVLVPWNTCGATQSSVLGVATLTFLPYCFFNIVSPFMSILFAYLNIKISRIYNKEKPNKLSE